MHGVSSSRGVVPVGLSFLTSYFIVCLARVKCVGVLRKMKGYRVEVKKGGRGGRVGIPLPPPPPPWVDKGGAISAGQGHEPVYSSASTELTHLISERKVPDGYCANVAGEPMRNDKK